MTDAKATPLPDISTPADVKIFVDLFYDKVMDDDLLRPVFVDVAGVDWDEHLPTMYSFWSSMLLGTASYKGAPFPLHAALREHLTPAHFTRWISVFRQTIDSLYSGEIAETAKVRAGNIAAVFQSKLGLLP